MLYRSISSVVCGALFIGSALASSPAVAADADTVEQGVVDTVADLVSDAAPTGATAGSDALVAIEEDGADVLGGKVRLTGDGDRSLRLSGTGITIQLPREVDPSAAELASNGMAVYQGESEGDPSVAVAATRESAAVHVVIPDASSPMRHSYEIGGASLVARPDGSVAMLDTAGGVIGFVDAPWAVDAAGNQVDTHYELEGDALVQVVEPTHSTQYPVVADPDFIFMAKCTAAIALFAAENTALIAKFWRVFKSAKRLAELLWDIRKMSKSGKIAYMKSRLGSIASELTGFGDLVSRCSP